METIAASPSISVARALLVAPWVERVRELGAPAEALLERTGLRPEVLRRPDAAVSLAQVLRWFERACRSLGTEHLDVHVGGAVTLEELGPYGRLLAKELTLHQYLRLGISPYGAVVSGQCFWLSPHGPRVRLHLGAPWEPRLGDYQSHLESFAITIATIPVRLSTASHRSRHGSFHV